MPDFKDAEALSRRIKEKALELGFSKAGIAPCEDFPEYARVIEERPAYSQFSQGEKSLVNACFPSQYFPQGKSVVCTVLGFADIDYPEKLLARIGRIYLARCYSPLSESPEGKRVQAMIDYLESLGMEVYPAGMPGKMNYPARMAGARAGVVSYGDNNFARTEEDGTFIVIYTFLVDRVLVYDEPTVENRCPEGCTKCIDACPTHALVGKRHLDPTRCILYNNMHKAMSAGEDVWAQMGEHFHGCDICQEVCPRNHKALTRLKRKDPVLEDLAERFDLEKVLFMDEAYYEDVVRRIMYNYIRDLDYFRANAAVALGNSGDTSHVPALRKAMQTYPAECVQRACAWALTRLGE